MASPQNNIKGVTEELKKFNNEAASLVSSLQDIAKVMGENAKAASEYTGEAASTFKEDAKQAVDLARELQGYTLNQLKDKRSLNAFESKINKTQQDQARTAARINALESKLISAKGEEARLIRASLNNLRDSQETMDEILKNAGQLKGKLDEINKSTKVFDDLSETFAAIPGASKVFGEFGKAATAAREAAAEGSDAFKAGAKELQGAVVKAVAAFAAAKLVQGLKNADERSVSLSRNLNKSSEDAERLVRGFNRAARSIKGITGADLQKASQGFAESLGTTAMASQATSEELATQVKYLGLEANEANDLAKYTEATGQDAKQFGNQLRGQVLISNSLNKEQLRYQDITKDVAKASAAVKLSTAGIGGNIVNAAIASRKLGMELGTLDNIAGSLLNFEDSISAELEAELITGKELNLEEARRLALNNDLEGVGKEIAKQGITAEKFGKMNRIQQEAIAKALGMNRDSLAESLQTQKALQVLGAKDTNEANAKVRLKLQEINAIQDISKREAARAKFAEEIGGEELIRQQENRTLAEKQAEANEKIVEAMDALLPILKPIGAAFDFIAQNAKILASVLTIFLGGQLISKVRGIIKAIRGMGSAMKSTAAVTEDLASTAAGGAGGAGGAASTAASTTAGAADDIAKNVASEAGEEVAKKGSTGFLGKVGNFFKKLNPVEKAKNLLSKAGPKKLFSKLAKFPGLGTLLAGFFAYQDIKDLVNNPVDENGNPLGKDEVNRRVGQTVAGALGNVLGGALGASVGGPIGAIAGSFGGEWLLRKAMEWLPGASEALGSVVTPFFEDKSGKTETIAAKDYIIKTLPEDTVVSAGGTSLGRTEEMVSLLQELLSVVKSGGNVYLDSTKVGTAMAVGTYKVQ